VFALTPHLSLLCFCLKTCLFLAVIWCFRFCWSKVTQPPNWDLNGQSKARVSFQNLQWYASLYLQQHACLCLLWKPGSNRNYSNYCSTVIIGGETENLSWTQKLPTRFVIGAFRLITLADWCGCVSNLIGRGAVNIPEVILGVHGLMGFTVTNSFLLYYSQAAEYIDPFQGPYFCNFG